MIIRPFVHEYFVYIDDGGLDEMNAPGYTFLLADSFTAQAIRKHVDGVKSSYKIARLHANEITRDNYRIYKDVYGEIFPAVIQELKKANWGTFVSRFGTTKEYQRNKRFVQEYLYKMLKQKKIVLDRNIRQVAEIADHVLVPLMVLNKIKRISVDSNVNLHVVIDRRKYFDVDAEKIIACSGNLYSGLLPVKELLRIIVNVWFDKIYTVLVDTNSSFKVSSTRITPSWKDSVLEVVDAIAYFSFQFFKCGLSNYVSSRNEIFKSEYFRGLIKMCNAEIDTDEMTAFVEANWTYDEDKVVSLSEQNIYVLEVVQI